LKVAETPALANNTKIGIRFSFALPNINRHKPPVRAIENHEISVIFIPIFLYMNPLIIMAGNSLREDVNVFKNILP
jgi:hypothetical protein